MSTATSPIDLAIRLHQKGDLEGANAAYRAAIESNHDQAEAWGLAGAVRAQLGDAAGAIALISTAVALSPNESLHYANLGSALELAGLRGRAQRAFGRALRIDPTHLDARANLGRSIAASGRLQEALRHIESCLELRPQHPEAALNLADTRRRAGEMAAAQSWATRAHHLLPGRWEPLLTGAQALAETGRFDDAIALLEEANSLSASNPTILWSAALILLARGEFAAGWRLFDSRFAANPNMPNPFPAGRLWRGEALAGKRLLVWWEQGIGDELLFASCLPELESDDVQVTVACDERVASLYRRSFPWARILGMRQRADLLRSVPADSFDFHIPSGSLAAMKRPSLEAFRTDDYLVPDPDRVRAWQSHLAALGDDLKVGFLWRGLQATEERRRHYSQLAEWAPVLRTANIQFISLQYGNSDAEIAALPADLRARLHVPRNFEPQNDFEGMAALVSALDLVISPGTAAAALAGALGRPLWMFTRGMDWMRLGTTGNPWMRRVLYFEAQDAADWSDAISRIGALLRQLVG